MGRQRVEVHGMERLDVHEAAEGARRGLRGGGARSNLGRRLWEGVT